MHPEYHATFENPERHADRDYSPEAGDINPFLHLSLHLAVAEQLAIDQPPGIRAQFERLRAARGDEHAALHAVLECLGEVIWSAQRLRHAARRCTVSRLPRAAALGRCQAISMRRVVQPTRHEPTLTFTAPLPRTTHETVRAPVVPRVCW